MTPVLDIHTHHPAPAPGAVVSLSAVQLVAHYGSPGEVVLLPDQMYSVGIHPWETTLEPLADNVLQMLEAVAALPQVVAIGECGVDAAKGAPMFRQVQLLRKQIELSERLSKPLIIHDVKAHDVVIGLRKELAPKQRWAIHGFRGKPSVAEMFTRLGIYLSFGQKFNPDTVRTVPEELMLAETDEAPVTIQDVIKALSDVRGTDVAGAILRNTATFLS